MDLCKLQYFFPNFQLTQFNMFDTISSIKWETVFNSDSGNEFHTVLITMTSPSNYKIVMEFFDVHSFRFQGNGQISGFYIRDMSLRGYENDSRYEIGDYEENEIKFYCSNILIKDVEKINPTVING